MSWKERLGVAAALALYVGLAVTASTRSSNTFDEVAHLTAGYSYWAFDDYRLQPENGNWPQRLAGLPAALRAARFPDRASLAWQRGDVWAVGDAFFFDHGNDIDRLLVEGRLLIALLGAGLGAAVFVWARRLTSPTGGWVALAFYVMSPTLLAHGALVTSDMAAALGLVVATALLWQIFHRLTLPRLVASAVATGALTLAKFSGLLIGPLAVVLMLVKIWQGRPLVWQVWRGDRWQSIRTRRAQAGVMAGVLALQAVIAVAMIWGSYSWRYSAFASGSSPASSFLVSWDTLLEAGRESVVKDAVQVAREHRLLPEAYLYGFSHTLRFSEARRSFLNGDVTDAGRVQFFPYAFAYKTTIPFMIAAAAGIAALVAGRGRRRRYRWTPIVTLFGMYGWGALTSDLNIGHRHLLPLYPLLMIVSGCAAAWAYPARRAPVPRAKGRKKANATPDVIRRGLHRPVLAALVLLGAWHAAESLAVRPHYLTYFNELAGGPSNGYRHLVDSSLDWGQGLPGVAAWFRDNPSAAAGPVYLSYFGTSRPAHFGIHARLLPGLFDRRPGPDASPLEPGTYLISATMLSGVYSPTSGRWSSKDEELYRSLDETVRILSSDPEARAAATKDHGSDPLPDAIRGYEQWRFARLTTYLRRREPDDQIDNSVLVYRLTAEDLARALNGPM